MTTRCGFTDYYQGRIWFPTQRPLAAQDARATRDGRVL